MMTLILFFILSFFCFISPSYSSSSPYPTQLSLSIQTESAPFGARSQQGVEALPSGSLIVLGTGPLGEQTNDCWKSTDDGINWSKVGSAPWAPRRGHRSLLMENNSTTELWVLGGYNANTNTYFNDVWMTNDECVSWNKIGDSFPGIEGPCVANAFDVALSTTGKMAQNNNAPSSNVYLSDDGSSWTFVADERVNGVQYTQWRLPSRAQARYNAACTRLGSLIVIAGGTNSTGGALTDIWAFDTSYEKWYQIRNLPVSRAGGIVIGRLPKLFLIGGKDLTDNTYKDDVWEWTMSSIDNMNNQLPWIKSFDSLSFGGLTSAATVYNSNTDKFIVVGGMNAGGSSSKILKIAMVDVPLCTGLTINNYE